MTPTPRALLKAMEFMPPRAAQVLRHAALEGLDVDGLAALYGVSASAAGVLLFRAARELDAALALRRAAPLSPEEEPALLAQFLSTWRVRAPEGPAAALVAMAGARSELRAALARAAAAELTGPRQRRATWFRWAATAAIVALSVYLYWRDHPL